MTHIILLSTGEILTAEITCNVLEESLMEIYIKDIRFWTKQAIRCIEHNYDSTCYDANHKYLPALVEVNNR